MPTVDIIEETFIVADPVAIRSAMCDPARWADWLPGCRLEVQEDRGAQGVRWRLSGALEGSAEVWLEPFADGLISHVYVRAEPGASDRPAPPGAAARRDPRRYDRHLKRCVTGLKDELEPPREVGAPRRVRTAGPTE